MDYRIRGRRAIVAASSQGLGKACAVALAQEGCEVCINGRYADKLSATAEEIRQATGSIVTAVVADITTADGRDRLVGSCPEADILVTNNAGPPPGALGSWDHAAWIGALESNMLAPALLIRTVVPGMVERRFGRIVNITSAMVKAPLPMMGLSTAARAGLTALCKAVSRDVAKHNVTINNLLLERIDTDRQRFMAEKIMGEKDITYDEARQEIIGTISAQRFGLPEEFGAACAFLCSSQSGFISGQNLQIDGGSYPGIV
jgi:3-oxoacyl-[acyl-carrier protein] reductase